MTAPGLVVVVAGGPSGPLDEAGLPAAPVRVIAADGGLDRALALGLAVDLVIGDMDSVTPSALAAAEAAGTRVERHPPNKDRTDLELALDVAVAEGAGLGRILVLGGAGGRFDHVLANALVLAAPAYAGVEIDALLGGARVAVVRDRRTLRGRPGGLVSLLPVHGPARAVRTEGLAYVLAGEDLMPGSTRGMSNLFAAEVATVTLGAGTLLAIQPATP